MNKITIVTDGGCSPNPGPGGWGAVLRYEGGRIEELSGNQESTTNNQMELMAVLQALAHLQEPHEVLIKTDSQLVILYLTSPTSAKQSELRAIRDLIREVIVAGGHKVRVIRASQFEVIRADALATAARELILPVAQEVVLE